MNDHRSSRKQKSAETLWLWPGRCTGDEIIDGVRPDDYSEGMDVFDAIRQRRSIKPEFMKPDPIDRELLEKLFDAANWAPSHGLTEPWRFIVFEGEGRRALAEALCQTMVDEGQDTLPLDDPRRQKITRKTETAPVIAAIVCAPSPKPNIVEFEEIESTAMAVQNLHLAARAAGLAGFWSSGKKAFHPRMASFLGLEAPSRCLGFFYLGYPAVEWPQGRRGPAADKVTWWAPNA
ncbi:MAG: nitroreductase [Myxococcota bacterium]